MKQTLMHFIRKAGLSMPVDRLRYLQKRLQNHSSLKAFQQENPEVVLPPPYYVYETFMLDYEKYYHGGKNTAKWIHDLIHKYSTKSVTTVYEWGCGPGRIVRHLPELMDDSCSIYGSDYNADYITWNSENLVGINFWTNELLPLGNKSQNVYDVVYAISVFTHLSEKACRQWFEWIMNSLSIGGLFIFTTQGEVFQRRLSASQKDDFEEKEIAIMKSSKEGHRSYSTFQSEKFIRSMVGVGQVVLFEEGKEYEGGIHQDLWIVKKTEY